MTYLAKPKLPPPTLPSNKLGFTRRDYEGKISTLCAGCGHDSISSAIIQAFFELDVPPHVVPQPLAAGLDDQQVGHLEAERGLGLQSPASAQNDGDQEQWSEPSHG